MIATTKKNIGMVRFLIDNGADTEVATAEVTPLLWYPTHFYLLRWCLFSDIHHGEVWAVFDIVISFLFLPQDGLNPLLIAAEDNNTDIVQLLLLAGASTEVSYKVNAIYRSISMTPACRYSYLHHWCYWFCVLCFFLRTDGPLLWWQFITITPRWSDFSWVEEPISEQEIRLLQYDSQPNLMHVHLLRCVSLLGKTDPFNYGSWHR